MRRIAVALGIFLLTALSGPVGAYPRTLSARDLQHIHTVAIISAVGGTFLFQHVKKRTFEWLGPPDSHFLEISDWALDTLVTKAVTAALPRRFAVKTIGFQPADFSTWSPPLLRRNTLDLNDDPDIDAYVLILRDWRADEIGHSVHALGGFGLYRRDGTPERLGIFASYRIVVVNALTGQILASRPALLPNGRLPWAPAPPTLWPRTQNDLTDAQRATLLADERRLIDETLGPALAAVGLAR